MGIRLQELIVPFKADTSGFAKAVTGGVLATVAAIGTAMVGAFVATEKWANELDSLGDVMGGTKEQLAAYAYTARVSKVGTEAFTKANIFLEKSLVKSNGRLDVGGKKLKEYGINVKDVNGKVKDQATLTQEIADKYKSFATQQEKVNFLTDIYGKQGAQLIDFFDVLNGEGGVDALSKKMKDLGLAIDPARYENFNRNIERLKMLGLALAVSFTEKVMPILERVLDWFIRIKDNPKVQKFLSDAQKSIDDFINNPNVQKVIDFFKSPTEMMNGKVVKGKSPFMQMLEDFKTEAANFDPKEFIANIDWYAVGKFIGDKVMAGLDLVNRGGLMIDEWVQELENKIDNTDWYAVFDKASNDILAFIEGLSGMSRGSLRNMLTGWGTDIRIGLDTLKGTIWTKLNEISNMFGAMVGGWIVNAWYNLNLRLKGFYGFLQKMVDTINKILSAITGINIQLPGGTTATTGGAGGGAGAKHRASGGAMTAGQPYDVVEFNKPETFIPAVNGKMVNGTAAQNSQPVRATIDEKKLGRVLRVELQKAGVI